MELCTSVIGRDANEKPIECGKPGVRQGEIVKCAKHWAFSRKRAEQIQRRIR